MRGPHPALIGEEEFEGPTEEERPDQPEEGGCHERDQKGPGNRV